MKVWRGILVVAIGVVCVGGARARAGEASKAESLIREGVALRAEGRDARALPLFQQAYELERTPRTAGQLGLCELALGYWLDADAHLAEGLASVSHPWIEKNRVVLSGALDKARENLGEITLAGGPPGAAVVVDRREVGRLPLARPLRLIKGPHDLEVRAGGREPWRQAVIVAGADKQAVTVAFVQAPAASAPPTVAAPVKVDDAEPQSSNTRRSLAWAGGAVALAGLGVAAVGTGLWVQRYREFQDHTEDRGGIPIQVCGNLEDDYGSPQCKTIHDRLSTARIVAIAGYGVAALFGAGSAFLFATSSKPRPKTDTALSCAPDVSGKGLSCFVTF